MFIKRAVLRFFTHTPPRRVLRDVTAASPIKRCVFPHLRNLGCMWNLLQPTEWASSGARPQETSPTSAYCPGTLLLSSKEAPLSLVSVRVATWRGTDHLSQGQVLARQPPNVQGSSSNVSRAAHALHGQARMPERES